MLSVRKCRRLAEEGRRIGFPLLVKAVLGGGGKGMKLARAPDDLQVCARYELYRYCDCDQPGLAALQLHPVAERRMQVKG